MARITWPPARTVEAGVVAERAEVRPELERVAIEGG